MLNGNARHQAIPPLILALERPLHRANAGLLLFDESWYRLAPFQ